MLGSPLGSPLGYPLGGVMLLKCTLLSWEVVGGEGGTWAGWWVLELCRSFREEDVGMFDVRGEADEGPDEGPDEGLELWGAERGVYEHGLGYMWV